MYIKVTAKEIFCKNYGWHTGRFHFAFADYEDPGNQNYGVLNALNEFIVQPSKGFETHQHEEMEIISYCVKGKLLHEDSMGNKNTLGRGDSQYTCTGTGITHSEMNGSSSEPMRFYQIWILPKQKGLQPSYRECHIGTSRANGHLRHIASGEHIGGVMQIAQDANIYAGEVKQTRYVRFHNKAKRQSYILCLEGNLAAQGIELHENDALKLKGEEDMQFQAGEDSHLLIVEMAGE
jgi:redox-sensitive bicupin YhaK (pirin superfamily)